MSTPEQTTNEHDSAEKTQRGIYLLPNLLTTAALFAGFYSIVAAMKGHFDAAAVAIFIAMIADGLDGRVARLTNTQSAFGAQYDSLSDMVAFGIAPALVLYSWSLMHLGTAYSPGDRSASGSRKHRDCSAACSRHSRWQNPEAPVITVWKSMNALDIVSKPP